MVEKIERKSNLPDTSSRWYAAYPKPCHEKRVAEHLETRKIESFLPLYRGSRRWNNGCKIQSQTPLLPANGFVTIPLNKRVRVLKLSGGVSIQGTPRNPTPLPHRHN